jgi:hypothetical protein
MIVGQSSGSRTPDRLRADGFHWHWQRFEIRNNNFLINVYHNIDKIKNINF